MGIIDCLRPGRSYHLQPDKTVLPRLIHLQSIMTSQVSANSSTTFPSAYYDPKGGTVINANFDSGNILVESVDSDCVTLRLRSEPFTEGTDKRCHSQWFYFRSSQIKGRSMSYRIVNAGQASYPAGFKYYKTFASYDGEHWYRVHDTTYDEAKGILLWNHCSAQDTVWFAYFPPFTYERHQQLIAKAAMSELCSLRVLGLLDHRPIDYLGRDRQVELVDQRPGTSGESMAEWFMEGLIHALLDEANEAAVAAVRSYYSYGPKHEP